MPAVTKNLVIEQKATFRRKADASTAGKEAHGFVLSAVSASANATVYSRVRIPNVPA